MITGFILLMFLAALAGYGHARLRRRLGLSVTLGHWMTTMAVVILAVLALWAYTTHK